MALNLRTVLSGYFSTSKLNQNFTDIESKVNDDLLHRQNGSAQMEQNIDMNGNSLLNVPDPLTDNEVANKKYIDDRVGNAFLYSQQSEASAAAALVSENNASNSELLAQKYAENPEDVEVVTGEYSAKHYSIKAADSAASVQSNVQSISELLSIVTPTDGERVGVRSYHIGLAGGGGVFYWDATGDKADHNGGTVIDPNVSFPTDWTNQTQLSTWFTAGTGTGVWRRQYDGAVITAMFGEKADGATIDYIPVQKAHDFVASSGSILGFKNVIFPAGIRNFGDNTLTWSANVGAYSAGAVVMQFANTSAKGIHISTEFGNWDTVNKQIRYNLKEVFAGNFVIENTLGSGLNTAIGMFLGDDGVDAFSAESIQLIGVKIRGWSKSHTFGSHAYIISWHHCRFDDNGTAVFIATGNGVDTYFDSWEKISYKECIFAGNTNAIDGDSGAQGDYSFDNCSVDYNDRILASFTNTAIIQFLNGCHIEWNSETDTAFSILGNVSIKDCYLFWLNATGTPPANLLAGIGANGVLTLDNNTYTFPSGTSVVVLGDSTSVFYGEENPLFYGGGSPTYINNSGGGTIYRTIEVIAGSGRSVTDEHGNRRQSFTIPNTALLANENKTVTVTYPEAFDTVVEYSNLTCQPDGSSDFYGVTQVVQTATPLSTVSFVIRNGALAQNATNIKGIAFGY